MSIYDPKIDFNTVLALSARLYDDEELWLDQSPEGNHAEFAGPISRVENYFEIINTEGINPGNPCFIIWGKKIFEELWEGDSVNEDRWELFHGLNNGISQEDGRLIIDPASNGPVAIQQEDLVDYEKKRYLFKIEVLPEASGSNGSDAFFGITSGWGIDPFAGIRVEHTIANGLRARAEASNFFPGSWTAMPAGVSEFAIEEEDGLLRFLYRVDKDSPWLVLDEKIHFFTSPPSIFLSANCLFNDPDRGNPVEYGPVVVNDKDDLNFGDEEEFTVVVVMERNTSAATNEGYFVKGAIPDSAFTFQRSSASNSSVRYYLEDDTATSESVFASIQNNTKYAFAMRRRDNGFGDFLLDGIVVAEFQTNVPGPIVAPQPAVIGARTHLGVAGMDGKIFGVAICKQHLTPEQIASVADWIENGPPDNLITIGREEVNYIGGSLRIVHSVSNRCNANFKFESDVHLDLKEGSPVYIRIGGKDHFRGVLMKPVETWPGPFNREYSVDASCFEYLAERRIMAASYQNMTLGEIVEDIVDNFLAADGVTKGTIESGPVATEAVFSYIFVSDALDKLAERANFRWHIDGNKVLTFGPVDLNPAPFVLDNIDEYADKAKVSKGNRDYRNRQYIFGGKAETEPQSESWKGDGEQKTFVTGFPIAREPTIELNGNPQTVAVKGIGDENADWFWARGSTEVTQNRSNPSLSPSDTLTIEYIGLFDLVVIAGDAAEIARRQEIEEFGTGIVDQRVVDTSITTAQSAFELSSGLLSKFAIEGRSISWDTVKEGLHSGQLLIVNLPDRGIENQEFFIEEVTVRDVGGGRVVYTPRAVQGPDDGNWVNWFKESFQEVDPLVFRENIGEDETLIILETFAENWTWEEEQIDETVHSCPVPSAALNPSTSLIPC